MVCTLEELRSKDVINVVNGENLGRIDNLQMNAQTASVTALILYGRPRLWGIFGPRDNCIIDFRQIRLVGKDVILVELGKICTDFTNIKLNSHKISAWRNLTGQHVFWYNNKAVHTSFLVYAGALQECRAGYTHKNGGGSKTILFRRTTQWA